MSIAGGSIASSSVAGSSNALPAKDIEAGTFTFTGHMRNPLETIAPYVVNPVVPGLPFSHDPTNGRIILDADNGTLGQTYMGAADDQWNPNSATKTIVTDEQVYHGDYSWKCTADAVSNNDNVFGGGYTPHFPDVIEGQTIRMQVPMYLPSNFDATTSTGVLKFLRLHVSSSSGGGHAGFFDMMLSEATDRHYWLSELDSSQNQEIPHTYIKGQWEVIEYHIKLNTATEAGNVKAFVAISGSMVEVMNIDLRTLTAAGQVVDSLLLFSYWNGVEDQTPVPLPTKEENCYIGRIAILIDQENLLTELSDTSVKVIGDAQ